MGSVGDAWSDPLDQLRDQVKLANAISYRRRVKTELVSLRPSLPASMS
jgi:hypothetical protein